jgi:ubiquinone biosynthesis protein
MPTSRALAVRAAHVCLVAAAVLVPAGCGALARAAVRGRAAGRAHLYRRLVHLITRLGPTFVKAGQVLGTRRDVLPGELCDELSVLQDSVPPLRPAETARALREAYDDPGAVFEEFGLEPVASGSVACVYRARLHSGQEVAVKLRRPGVARLMTLDVTVIQRIAAVMARLPVLRGLPVNEVMRHMGDAVLGQLDFAREAASLRRLRANLAVVPRVWVPLVHLAESRPRSIVMEFIPGLDVEAPRRHPPAARRRFAASGLTSIYQMLFVDGFVHCDMHPGNLYFTDRSQVVVLDAGFSVQLSERLRRLFAEFFMNMSIGRGERCAEIVLESAAGLRDSADPAGFRVRMADLVRRNHKVPAKDFSLMAFATEMFDLQRRFGVHAAPELIFPLLSLLVIEGTVHDLDPELDFQETAKPVLMRGLFGQRSVT